MRKLFLALAFAALFCIAVFSIQAAGQEGGCCCDPIVHNGSLVPEREECDETYFNFTNVTSEQLGMQCDEICDAKFGVEIVIPPPLSCESPDYAPPPGGVIVLPVKGKKQLRITYNVPCPNQANSIDILRCAGSPCEDFVPVATASPTGVYVDNEVLWKTDYTYKLVLNYRISKQSEPVIKSGNAGDLECWYKGYEKFCVSSYYYDLFEQYLRTFGYEDTPEAAFDAFSPTVIAVFQDKFNRGWECDGANILYQRPGAVNCVQGDLCVSGADSIMCVTPTPCSMGGIFGMYSTQQACEGTATSPKYCFHDRSAGSIDKCYSCSQQMSCADYRSKGACGRDNCHAGNCSWRDVFPDIGIGVCVDNRFPNCLWCKTPGTMGLENIEAYNEIFDQCTIKKSEALTVPGYLCVFDKNSQESNDCNSVACMDYNDTQCGSPAGGIKLNPDNSLAATSTDPCNILVCQNVSGIGCVKNADGNSVLDCGLRASDRRQCELDHFPPNTTLVPESSKPDRMDWLYAKMFDKRNGTDEGAYMEGKQGYRLRVCVGAAECSDAASFAQTNLSSLNFNDLYLQAGRDVVAYLDDGPNILQFYGIDRSNNVEVVKEMNVLACSRCQGPKVLEIAVDPSNYVAGRYYTISDTPVITVSFNEPSAITVASLTLGNKVIPVTMTPASGANYEYTFVPITPLDDGDYALVFNAKDSNGVLMDGDGGRADITVDTTPGDVTIEPADGSVITESSVPVSFTFSEAVDLEVATFENEIWTSKYSARKAKVDLLPVLEVAGDGSVYSTLLEALLGGKKNLYVQAKDIAGNPIIGKSSFWINQGPLQMRMRQPAWGVSPTYMFDIVIDTSISAVCKYLYGVPSPFPVSAFDEALSAFSKETEVVHTIEEFDKIPAGDTKEHKLHVYCKSGQNITLTTFDLRVDTSPPTIVSAYADPKVIIERRKPDSEIFTTHIKVQTNEEGFCKYSAENVAFARMNGLFSGFDEIPKLSHDAEINVTEDKKSYTYYVACKNTAQLPSATVPVTFSVDTSVPFAAKSLTPPYSNNTNITLRIETNKRAFCYAGESADTVINLVGPYGYAHIYPVSVNSSGNYTWFVKCSTGAGNEVVDLKIPVLVDITLPVMKYVDDSSNLLNDTEYSYFLNQLQVSFLGYDNETAVNAYYYRLLTFHSNDTVRNWTMSTNTNGTAFYVTGLNLTDGNKYRFEAYPVNIVGLRGGSMMSNGVTIDVEKAPTACENRVKDDDEADIDCGGDCPGCIDGMNCNANADCASGFCSNGVCSIVSCFDQAKNGNETDVDCGGGSCSPCVNDKACVNNADCASGSCNFGMCGEPDPCADGVLTGTESDIDCGGSCSNKCGDGKNCQSSDDCIIGLMCLESTCQGTHDTDMDGVPDDRDRCPNTPPGDIVDEYGCSASQKFSCDDSIPDGWRIKYFGSILCTGDGAPDADPDNDGLTNLDEYRNGTDPTNPDTDYDGWNDRVEVDAGTDPLDSASHPPSKLRILLWIFLILMILGAIGIGGWLGYQYYMEKRLEGIPKSIPAKEEPKAPEKKLKPWPPVVEQLRKIARKEEPGVVDRDWVSIAELSERLKKEKVPVGKDVFGRLKDILEGKPSKKGLAEAMSEIRKEPEAFKLLRKISFEKLTPEEKEIVRARLAFLKSGKITSAELEEILTKLRVTAAYYRAHKEELERELEEWLKEVRHK
jgi:hypothetical protein